jgi:hypothetical protein
LERALMVLLEKMEFWRLNEMFRRIKSRGFVAT